MLLIYLPVTSPRCEYIFDWIFSQNLCIPYQLTDNIFEFINYSDEKINYSEKQLGAGFYIKSTGFLTDDSIKMIAPEVGIINKTKVLFPDKESTIGFDIFSAVFFLISRYEEYLPFIPDEFGKYSEKESIAFKNDFLHLPVVDTWIVFLKEALQKQFFSLHFKTHDFKAIHTYDIDVAFKYQGRSVIRTCGAMIKNLLQFDFIKRILVLTCIQKDPWDTYQTLRDILKENQSDSIFFFLVAAQKSRYDRNLKSENHRMKKLVKEISSFSKIGLHPSFYSTSKPEKISQEKLILEKLSGTIITKSRQHFLKFNLPGTYLNLIQAGITEDYSMGFTNTCGFRAGTSKPFYFYDLKNEKTTSLRIFPVAYMEGTFFKTHTPDEAFKEMKKILQEVKKVNGTFISIWHNHTVSEDYSDWKKVHDKMIKEIYE